MSFSYQLLIDMKKVEFWIETGNIGKNKLFKKIKWAILTPFLNGFITFVKFRKKCYD